MVLERILISPESEKLVKLKVYKVVSSAGRELQGYYITSAFQRQGWKG